MHSRARKTIVLGGLICAVGLATWVVFQRKPSVPSPTTSHPDSPGKAPVPTHPSPRATARGEESRAPDAPAQSQRVDGDLSAIVAALRDAIQRHNDTECETLLAQLRAWPDVAALVAALSNEVMKCLQPSVASQLANAVAGYKGPGPSPTCQLMLKALSELRGDAENRLFNSNVGEFIEALRALGRRPEDLDDASVSLGIRDPQFSVVRRALIETVGMAHARQHADRLRTIIADTTEKSDIRIVAARSLVLLGTAEDLITLSTTISSTKSRSTKVSLLCSMALFGDYRTAYGIMRDTVVHDKDLETSDLGDAILALRNAHSGQPSGDAETMIRFLKEQAEIEASRDPSLSAHLLQALGVSATREFKNAVRSTAGLREYLLARAKEDDGGNSFLAISAATAWIHTSTDATEVLRAIEVLGDRRSVGSIYSSIGTPLEAMTDEAAREKYRADATRALATGLARAENDPRTEDEWVIEAVLWGCRSLRACDLIKEIDRIATDEARSQRIRDLAREVERELNEQLAGRKK